MSSSLGVAAVSVGAGPAVRCGLAFWPPQRVTRVALEPLDVLECIDIERTAPIDMRP